MWECDLAAAGAIAMGTWCMCSSLVAPASRFLAGRLGGASRAVLWGRSLVGAGVGEGGWMDTEGWPSLPSGCHTKSSRMREMGREVDPPMMETPAVFARISSTEWLERTDEMINKEQGKKYGTWTQRTLALNGLWLTLVLSESLLGEPVEVEG